MARMIDANALQELCNRRIQDTWNSRTAPVSWAEAYADFKDDIDSIPTLTPPNEWISVETPPTKQGWYHVAVLDLKTGKYTVEQDLYSIELAKAHGFEPGFCKAKRWEKRERIDYWCRFPEPPDRRPLAREEDT